MANNPGMATDSRGWAVVPYLQPYREDAVALELEGIDGDSTLENTEVRLAPTGGAVVLAQFVAHTGRKILATLHQPDGSTVPFGTTATAGEQSNKGIVDECGQVFLSGVPESGQIVVSWGDTPHQCRASYQLPPGNGKHLYELSA